MKGIESIDVVSIETKRYRRLWVARGNGKEFHTVAAVKENELGQ